MELSIRPLTMTRRPSSTAQNAPAHWSACPAPAREDGKRGHDRSRLTRVSPASVKRSSATRLLPRVYKVQTTILHKDDGMDRRIYSRKICRQFRLL